jgi:hypothetical protein
MRQEEQWIKWTLDTSVDDQKLQDYVWGSSEKAKMKAFSLYVIRSIVEKHGGTVDIDLATDTISIDVPDEEQVACAQEIEEQVGSMCR